MADNLTIELGLIQLSDRISCCLASSSLPAIRLVGKHPYASVSTCTLKSIIRNVTYRQYEAQADPNSREY